MLGELDVRPLQGFGQQHTVLVVHDIVCISMVQHPGLVPKTLNSDQEAFKTFFALNYPEITLLL